MRARRTRGGDAPPPTGPNLMKQKYRAPQSGASRIVLALALAGSCAWAQQEQQAEETELAPVTVSAHDGQAVPTDSTGVSVTVVDVAALRDTEDVYTVSDALTTVPGLYVLPGGGINQQGNVSYVVTRGLKSDAYTQTVVDGMRLNSSSGNGLVTSNVIARANMFDIQQLEVLRGAQGATYGGGAMAGVLYMETPEGKGKPSYTLFSEGGSHDSYTGNMRAQGRVGKLGYFLSATHTHTNNDFEKADGSRLNVKHAGRYENDAEALRLDYAINESAKATLTYRREDSSFGAAATSIDWSGVPVDDINTYDFRTNLITAKLQSKVSERFSTSLMAGYYGSDSSMPSAYSPFDQNIRNIQTEWRNLYKWNERHRTMGGLSWQRSQYTADNGEGKRNSSRSLENLYSIFAEHTYTPVKRWENGLAGRLDESSIFDTQGTLRASSSLKFNKKRTRVFGSVGTGYRAPDAFARSNNSYTSRGTTYYGNNKLDPEHSATADAGIEHEYLEQQTVSATLFLTRTEDAILTAWNPDLNGMQYTNSTGHSTIQGVELAARGTWERGRKSGYTLSCTLAEPKNEHRQLAETARQVLYGDIHTSPTEALTLGIGLTAVSGRTDWNRRKQDAFYTLRCYADYKVNEHLSFHVRAENLTNQKFVTSPTYNYNAYPCTEVPGQALINAGAALYAGCTVTF